MAQQGVGRNRSAQPKGVFDNFGRPLPVHEGDVEADFCQASCGLTGKKFFSRFVDTLHLSCRQTFGCACEVATLLDLYKYQRGAVAQNKINFSDAAAPASPRNGESTSFIILRDPIFSSETCVVGHSPTLSLCIGT
ncbi:hypothetical protein SAMN04489759_11623 [Sulfitobacter delicatus]|uniref:Uncharacterized protein n=1 Tax=Sulfitobacter delicatus TaxID=218672 RepID=A0A1G7YNA8_9RHOB|nr:hypothetical protein SAMN04489759_11623 [Sulfitobacter delicatus]